METEPKRLAGGVQGSVAGQIDSQIFVDLSTGNERSVSVVGKYVDRCSLPAESY